MVVLVVLVCITEAGVVDDVDDPVVLEPELVLEVLMLSDVAVVEDWEEKEVELKSVCVVAVVDEALPVLLLAVEPLPAGQPWPFSGGEHRKLTACWFWKRPMSEVVPPGAVQALLILVVTASRADWQAEEQEQSCPVV